MSDDGMAPIRDRYDAVVVGGGPAGSTVAGFLARFGHDVLVVERDRFPRHHVGESMIAATIDVLAELGLEDKLAAAEFPVKSGGCFIWGETVEPWCVRFDEVPGRPTSYQVKRDVFDALLLDHAADLGAEVRQRHRVVDLVREAGRVAGVVIETPAGDEQRVEAAWTIDASGLAAVVANRVSTREPVDELRNVALYGYWAGAHPAPAGLGGDIRATDRNNIIIKWLDHGWLWFIPLGHGDLISVGYVTAKDHLPVGGVDALEAHLHDRIGASEELTYLLSGSEYTGEFHTVRDWSYRSARMAGDGYIAVGDAACFVDPILSSGVYLAVLYAKLAAVAVHTSLTEPGRDELVRHWYEGLYHDTWEDYVRMARFWYRGDRSVSGWMSEARQATDHDTTFADSDRSSFIGLATGNTHAHPTYVLDCQLPSLPWPVRLRKDPRGGFHREASVLLQRHAARDSAVAEVSEVARAGAALSTTRRRREAVARLLGAGQRVVDRLTVDAGKVPAEHEALVVDGRPGLTVEVVEDLVTLVLDTPAGRRRLSVTESAMLAAFSTPATVAEVADGIGAAQDEVSDFAAELLDAGALLAAATRGSRRGPGR